MKKFLKFLFATLILLACGSILIMFLYKKTITEGRFGGLEIGQTKSEVFNHLQSMANISAIGTADHKTIRVNKDNLEDLSLLNEVEGFNIVGVGTQIVVFFENQEVTHVLGTSPSEELSAIREGMSFDTVKQYIENFILAGMARNEARAVISRPLGFGPDRTNTLVDPKQAFSSSNREAFDWLMSKNIWFFTNTDRYTRFTLYFVNDRLNVIEYRNSFFEWP